MFENLKDMGKLMKQAKEMKDKMKTIQEKLKKTKVVGKAENGRVLVELTGELECTNVQIDPALMSANQTVTLQKALLKAFNEAANQAKNIATSELSSVSGGLNLPGF